MFVLYHQEEALQQKLFLTFPSLCIIDVMFVWHQEEA
jgi:hypothetical protein